VAGEGAREGARERRRPADRVVTGNWTDPAFLHGEVHDTVLADYLLGAVEGFAPYFQDRLFARLRPHVGGRLYVVGLEPYPDESDEPAGRVVLEIARLANACILLAGHRMFREYPADWAVRSLEAAGYRVDDVKRFPIVRGPKFVNEQMDVCTRKLKFIQDKGLACQLEASIASLRDRALAQCHVDGGLRFGEDYVLSATRS
jgi:hypothetical protein